MRVRPRPALPGRREFPQRPAHCLQALICQGRHPFHRHLPPLAPAGLGFPLEAEAGAGIRGHSRRGQLCVHTACQASLPRARVSGSAGGRRTEPLLLGCSPSPCSAVPQPSFLSSSLLFDFFLFPCVSAHVGEHACACVPVCPWRLEVIRCLLQSSPTLTKTCVCFIIGVWERWGAPRCMWRSEGNLRESLLSSSCGLWGRDSGHQACLASALTCWALLPALCLTCGGSH